MADDHKSNSEKSSVEQNLAKDYVSKSKLGNLPISNQIDEAMKKKMNETQKGIEKFKTEILKKHKSVEAIGIIPAQAAKKIEEEYEISGEDAKKGLIHILTVIPEKQFKNIKQIRLDAISASRKINDKFWVHVMTPVDFWNLGLDSKFDIMEAIAMSYPVMDKGILSHIRVAQIHKSLVLKKFEKYVTSYVIYGSLTRGEAKKTSDVDVSVIIDDTDVKRMPRAELKEKLRGIIYSYIQEAEAIAGVGKNTLNVQIWLMTEFWEGVKDAHPVFFTFIRDGVPLYDRGTFLPWKSLLRMGKIKPSPEAIDMFMSSGNKLKEIIQKRIFDVATLDLFWGISTPTQGLLMLYGLAPSTPKETVKLFREVFYEKEKLVEEKYVLILEEILIKVWKAYEHGKLKPGDIDGKELDRLSKNAIDYMKRINELREQIEKRVQEKSIEQIYNDVFGMLGSLLKKKSEAEIIKEFDEKIIKEGKFPPRFLENLKLISKTKKDVANARVNKNITQKKKLKPKIKKDNLTMKQSRNVDNARKLATEITTALMEYTQRCELATIEKSRFLIKGKETNAEVFFLSKTFIIHSGKVQKIFGEKLINSTPKELQEQLAAHEGKETKINFKSIGVLKKVFGEFDLVY
ncbi:MAG: nucleotidyltransferase domain-containing protein [Desulfobulbaceae bacterium]|nr:nucleotidyltransferase domain-containing protein [Desulfobulbaceae bacterium]